MSALSSVVGPDTWNITLDQILDPFKQICFNRLRHPADSKAKEEFENRVTPIILCNLKTLLFNIANVLLVVAAIFGIMFNPAAALVYGAIGLGVRYITQRELEPLGKTRQEIFQKLEIDEKVDPSWTPYKLIFCGVPLWRNGLPICL